MTLDIGAQKNWPTVETPEAPFSVEVVRVDGCEDRWDIVLFEHDTAGGTYRRPSAGDFSREETAQRVAALMNAAYYRGCSDAYFSQAVQHA